MSKILACLILVLLAFAVSPVKAEPEGIAAIVNQEVIAYTDIDSDPQAYKEMADLRQKYQGETLSDRFRGTKLQTLDRLIDSRLIIQDFRRQGGFTPASYVDEQVEADTKQNYGGKKELLAAALARSGETMEEYRAKLEDIAIIGFMTQENVEKKVTAIDPAEAAKQRASLRQAWLASLRGRAYIHSFLPSK